MEEVDQAPFFMGYHGKIIENHLSMRVSLTANIIQWLVVFKHSFFTPGMRIPLLWKEGWPHQHHPTEVVRFSISGIFVLPAGFAQANPRDWRGWTDAGRFYGGNGSICCREKPGALFGSLLRKDAEDEENEEWGLDVWLAVKKKHMFQGSWKFSSLLFIVHPGTMFDLQSPHIFFQKFQWISVAHQPLTRLGKHQLFGYRLPGAAAIVHLAIGLHDDRCNSRLAAWVMAV